MNRMAGHSVLMLPTLPAWAATLARWEAGKPPLAEGIDLHVGSQEDFG